MSRDKTEYVVIHCAATPSSMDIGAREIDRWHRSRGFLRIGYHYVIRRNGFVESDPLCRPLDSAGAHAAGFNNRSVAVCLVGGLSADGKKGEDNFTPEQKDALAGLLKHMRVRYPNAKVCGHRDLEGVNKDCPSFDVMSWWASREESK